MRLFANHMQPLLEGKDAPSRNHLPQLNCVQTVAEKRWTQAITAMELWYKTWRLRGCCQKASIRDETTSQVFKGAAKKVRAQAPTKRFPMGDTSARSFSDYEWVMTDQQTDLRAYKAICIVPHSFAAPLVDCWTWRINFYILVCTFRNINFNSPPFNVFFCKLRRSARARRPVLVAFCTIGADLTREIMSLSHLFNGCTFYRLQ